MATGVRREGKEGQRGRSVRGRALCRGTHGEEVEEMETVCVAW